MWPLAASANPQACRSMCECALKPIFASAPTRSIIRAKPAVVKGDPRSECEHKRRLWLLLFVVGESLAHPQNFFTDGNTLVPAGRSLITEKLPDHDIRVPILGMGREVAI